MEIINSIRLNEILIELVDLGDELEDIADSQTDNAIGYELSMACSELVDARVYLRTALSMNPECDDYLKTE